jgi:hypothetical protein
MDLRQIVCEGVDWIHLAHDAVQWLAVANVEFGMCWSADRLLDSENYCSLDIITCIFGCIKNAQICILARIAQSV